MRRNERKMHRSHAKRVEQSSMPPAIHDNGQSKVHLRNVSHPQTERSLSRLTNDSKLCVIPLKTATELCSARNVCLKTRILTCRQTAHAILNPPPSRIFLIEIGLLDISSSKNLPSYNFSNHVFFAVNKKAFNFLTRLRRKVEKSNSYFSKVRKFVDNKESLFSWKWVHLYLWIFLLTIIILLLYIEKSKRSWNASKTPIFCNKKDLSFLNWNHDSCNECTMLRSKD